MRNDARSAILRGSDLINVTTQRCTDTVDVAIRCVRLIRPSVKTRLVILGGVGARPGLSSHSLYCASLVPLTRVQPRTIVDYVSLSARERTDILRPTVASCLAKIESWPKKVILLLNRRANKHKARAAGEYCARLPNEQPAKRYRNVKTYIGSESGFEHRRECSKNEVQTSYTRFYFRPQARGAASEDQARATAAAIDSGKGCTHAALQDEVIHQGADGRAARWPNNEMLHAGRGPGIRALLVDDLSRHVLRIRSERRER